MTVRPWLAACCVGVLLACASEQPASMVSTRPGDAGSHEEEDAASEPSGPRDSGRSDAESNDEQDASDPQRPPPPETNGVHLAVGRGAYETARDAFYFETDRPSIRAELDGGVVLQVALSEQLGVLRCSDGGRVEYEVPEGSFIADSDHGACTIGVEAFGTRAGAPIEATFSATVVRAVGEIADELELRGRVQVGHP